MVARFPVAYVTLWLYSRCWLLNQRRSSVATGGIPQPQEADSLNDEIISQRSKVCRALTCFSMPQLCTSTTLQVSSTYESYRNKTISTFQASLISPAHDFIKSWTNKVVKWPMIDRLEKFPCFSSAALLKQENRIQKSDLLVVKEKLN